MATALVHLIGTTALHGALREVADEVAHHGYLILFVLIAAESFAFPLPGEVSLLVGAYEAQRGVFGLGWVIVIGALAAISGDNLAYLLGRRSGRALVVRLLRVLHVRSAYLERLAASLGLHAVADTGIAALLWLRCASRRPPPPALPVHWRRFAAFNAPRLHRLGDGRDPARHPPGAPSRRARRRFLGLAGLVAVTAIGVLAAVMLWRRLRRQVSAASQVNEAQAHSDERQVGSTNHAPGVSEGPRVAGPSSGAEHGRSCEENRSRERREGDR